MILLYWVTCLIPVAGFSVGESTKTSQFQNKLAGVAYRKGRNTREDH